MSERIRYATVCSGPQVAFPFGDGVPEANVIAVVDEVAFPVQAVICHSIIPAIGSRVKVVEMSDYRGLKNLVRYRLY